MATVNTVGELIKELQQLDPNCTLRLAVGWSGDTANSDRQEPITVGDDIGDKNRIVLRSWMSDCDTTLEFTTEDSEEEEEP